LSLSRRPQDQEGRAGQPPLSQIMWTETVDGSAAERGISWGGTCASTQPDTQSALFSLNPHSQPLGSIMLLAHFTDEGTKA
jgi:hypothetical protein